ncbi:hypothetical protein [Enterococcus sp. AZ109]|uniref:hypothetical protein n=1 Tax=Enterococcus sp. AZ109 TaxID=2774634 RepID=UPI003F20E17B
MQKVSGVYFTRPLDLYQKIPFEVDISHDALYAKDCSILECNQLILNEIASKYQHSIEELHGFFVINNILEA